MLVVILIACQRSSNSSAEGGDTLSISDAGFPVTEENRTNLNDQVSESRQNAITRAVKEISPAVVGINVIEIKEVRQRNPFSNNPQRLLFERRDSYNFGQTKRDRHSCGQGQPLCAACR